MPDAPQPVAADTPVEAPKAPKERNYHDFGTANEAQPNFTLPAALPQGKTEQRELVRKSGALPVKAVGYLTTKEVHAVLKGEFPIEVKTNYLGHTFPDGTKAKNVKELLAVAGDRRKTYSEMEKVRSAERDGERKEALGELATQHPGRGMEARRARLVANLEADAPWVPLDTQAQRQPGRFYDVDGQAGRRTAFRIAPKASLKVDGTPKANTTIKLMSPGTYDELIKGDAALSQLVEVPEGFNVAPKKEAKVKAPRKPRGPKVTTEEALAAADDAVAGEPAESVDDAVGTANTPEVPTL